MCDEIECVCECVCVSVCECVCVVVFVFERESVCVCLREREREIERERLSVFGCTFVCVRQKKERETFESSMIKNQSECTPCASIFHMAKFSPRDNLKGEIFAYITSCRWI